MKKMYFVYILTNKHHSVFYVGMTNNLPRRMVEHKTKVMPGFTSRYNVNHLVYFESVDTLTQALYRERLLKRWPRQWKINLVTSFNLRWEDLANNF